MNRLASSFIVLLCSTVTFAADATSDGLAKALLAKAGIRATLCEMPRVGDGTLAAALAGNVGRRFNPE